MTSLLTVEDLSVTFSGARSHMFAPPVKIHSLRGVSFALKAGETLAIVGESGSGKSTLARAISRLVTADGRVSLNGHDLLAAAPSQLKGLRRDLQMVFQDPYSSLDRRMRIADILLEPLNVHGSGTPAERRARVHELVEQVGLSPAILSRFPAGLSGGQRQRVAIARALAMRPQLVICDEAVSALDVSVQAQILNLLGALKSGYGLAYLFITHDLGVVRRFADRIAVMHAGRVVELAPAGALFERPLHPYTRALLSAVPRPEREATAQQRIPMRGEPPSPLETPKGCLFASRCAHHRPGLCDASDPGLVEHALNHQVACHRAQDGRAIWEADGTPGGLQS